MTSPATIAPPELDELCVNTLRFSDVETFCALRFFIDSWRWEGVPWYLRPANVWSKRPTRSWWS